MRLKMASISELVCDVSDVMGEPRETVTAFARALIDAGDLPKSRGRAIAQVSDEEIAKLMVIVALSPKIKDASKTLNRYWAMTPRAGGPLSDLTFGTWLASMVATIFNEAADESERDARKAMFDHTIHLIETWPQAEVYSCGECLIRFQHEHSLFWNAHIQRKSVISMRAFLMLGFGKGRDYLRWTA